MAKDKKREKRRKGLCEVSAAISSTQRREEIEKGMLAFANSRENEDLFLV